MIESSWPCGYPGWASTLDPDTLIRVWSHSEAMNPWPTETPEPSAHAPPKGRRKPSRG